MNAAEEETAKAKALQNVARHSMILRLLQDIRFDLHVCEVEGWDKTEYIRMLQNELNRFEIGEPKK